ncbi:MAG: hypothetical protein Q8N26_01625 [Myxococcales bacterium]|nr:hypothetical protein [Myxococcales bacterium]
MRMVIAFIVVFSSLATAQTPDCTPERASLLFDLGPTQQPRLVKCDGQRWVPWEVPAELCTSAPLDAGVVAAPTAITVVEKTPEQLAACKSSCATQNAYCLKTQCGPIAGAPCKQRCAKSLAICTTGCTPKPPEPERPTMAAPVPQAAPVASQPPPMPVRNAPPPPPGPSALETFGKALDVVDRGLGVFDGPSQPSSAPGGSGSSGVSASATCCLNGAGYSCPSAAAVDRCSGAFMRCMMGGKSGEKCMKESPPDPSGCRRDMSIVCK